MGAINRRHATLANTLLDGKGVNLSTHQLIGMHETGNPLYQSSSPLTLQYITLRMGKRRFGGDYSTTSRRTIGQDYPQLYRYNQCAWNELRTRAYVNVEVETVCDRFICP